MKGTLLELQTLKQSVANKNEEENGALADTMISEESSKKRDASQLDGPVETEESNILSKRPRRRCNKEKTYSESEDTIDEEKSNDETDSHTDEKVSMIDTINEEKAQSTIVNTVRLEQKRFNVTGMNLKELRKKCRDVGISDRGNDLQLKARIKRFGDVWKAECDGEIHRPADVILKEFKKAEALRDVSSTLFIFLFDVSFRSTCM